MPQATQRWTADMVRELPDDGNRYEVIGGELFVTPAPNFDHQTAVLRLALRLAPFFDTQHLGHALLSPADIEFDEADLVQPDLFVAPRIETRPRRWSDIKTLVLAVRPWSATDAPTTSR